MTDRQIIARIDALSLELENRQARRKLRRLTPVGATKTRADLIREIPIGGFADFAAKTATEAASVRGSAYQALGRGRVTCQRISGKAVRVRRER